MMNFNGIFISSNYSIKLLSRHSIIVLNRSILGLETIIFPTTESSPLNNCDVIDKLYKIYPPIIVPGGSTPFDFF